MKGIHILLFTLAFTALVSGQTLWKVFCDSTPIYRGRIDSIVNPGKPAGHSHIVFGANNFNPGDPSRSHVDEFDILRKSSCTTCSISVDKTAYWIPDLYYRWPNGTFSVVPTSGLTVYYPARSGSGNQTNPKWTAYPPGLRILAGNPYRRSFNQSSVADRAINYNCIGVNGPETNAFPEDIVACSYGLRAQVWFPMCWDGVNLDSPDHKSHMAYPIESPDNGNCPSTHPVRVPGIFYEVLFSVSKFPRQAGINPFVWSCGDSTGYGLHGDFLNGWDPAILQKAVEDPTCYYTNTNNGNNVRACNTLAPYVRDDSVDNECLLSAPIYLNEDLGLNHPITALPGCNPVTSGPENASPCTTNTPQPSSGPGWRRFLLQPKTSSLYVSAKSEKVPLTASVTTPSASEIWTMNQFSVGHSIQSDLTGQYVTAPNKDAMQANRNSPDDWETFIFTAEADGYHSIIALSNNLSISLSDDGTLHADSRTVGDKQLFKLVDPATVSSGDLSGAIPTNPPPNPNPSNTNPNNTNDPAKTEDEDTSAVARVVVSACQLLFLVFVSFVVFV